jgi:hypothetical protein
MYRIRIEFSDPERQRNHTMDTGSMVSNVPTQSSDWVGVLAAICNSVELHEDDRETLRDLI